MRRGRQEKREEKPAASGEGAVGAYIGAHPWQWLAVRGLIRAAAFGLSLPLVTSILAMTSNVPTGPLLPLIEDELSEAAGSEIEVDGLFVRIAPRDLVIYFDRLTADGAQSVLAENGRAVMPYGGFLHRELAPRELSVTRIVAEARALEPGAVAEAEDVRDLRDEVAPLPLERLLTLLSSGAVDEVALPDVTIAYLSADGEPVVTLDSGSVGARMREDGFAVTARLPFVFAGQKTEADLEVLARPSGITDVSFLTDGTPIAPVLAVLGVDAFSMEGSVEGRVNLSVDGEGRPVDGSIDLALPPGEGAMAGRSFAFGQNRLEATFDAGSPVFRIETLDYDIAGNQGRLGGTVAAENLLDPAELLLAFDVHGESIHVDLGSFMDGPLDVERIDAKGSFDAAGRRLAFDELRSTYFGSELKGFLALTFPEGFSGSPRLEADALLPGPLSPDEVLAGWPRPLALDARNWVVDNLKSGRLTNLAYVADIPMGAIKPATPLANEDMRFTFDASEATVIYLPDMPPITGLEATATVRGNSFEVLAERGYVSGVRLTEAKLDMPRFMPAGATATFDSTLMGDVETILSALQEAGLVDFEEGVTYTPQDFDGMGSFDLSVTWPLIAEPLLDDVKVTGEGAFARGSIDNVLPGIDASDAGGRVTLTPDMLTVRGDGLAASAPAKFVWRQNLRGEMKADLAVTAELDTLTADMIGLPLRQFFRGEIAADIYARDLTPGSPLKITGDLTRASVSIPELGVSKPRGVEGFVETTVAIPEASDDPEATGLITLNELKLRAPTFNIEGAGVFTQEGGVVRLELPRFFIEDKADLSLRLVTENQNLDLDVTGEHADASALIDKMFGLSGKGGPLPGRSELDIALSRVSLKNGVTLNDVSAEGQHDGQDFEQFTLMAEIGENGVLSATFDAPPTEELGFVEVESTDFGTLMDGVFGVASFNGGAGSIKGTTIEDGGFRGRFEVGELIIQDAPILAKILSFTSLDGAIAALNGEGIRFSKLEGDVWTKDGQIGLGDAKLVGSSLGVSATGVIDLEANTIDVRGAIAPAYAVNSILGSLPGIGRLFVSREGEGIVAFSYSITGSLEAPVVTVNTLSALTPGILRRIFEPVTRNEEETRRFLDEAIAEAQKQGDLNEAPQ